MTEEQLNAPTPVLNKLRKIEAENRRLKRTIEELEAGRDLMSIRQVADYLGFSTSAVTQLITSDTPTRERLPRPYVEWPTPTSRVWLKSQIVAYGERLGTNRGYKPRTKKGKADD